MTQRFSGLGLHLGNLSRLSRREVALDQPGELHRRKGQGRHGRRTAPARSTRAASAAAGRSRPRCASRRARRCCSATSKGTGAIQQIWMTPADVRWRDLILRIYWDDQEQPSVEAPLGDFFACGWGRYAQVNSLAVCVNPGRAFNCYWEMPFRKRARITLENRDPDAEAVIYYQINYTLTDVPEDAAYFHAQFRRTNPLPYKQDYIDPRRRAGAAAITSAPTWPGASTTPAGGARARSSSSSTATNSRPSAAPGTEDYFCGAYNFDAGTVDPTFPRAYIEFTTPYAGLPQVIRPDGTYQSQQRFGLYRWHIMDPIRFESDLRVTMQALGWRTREGEPPLSAAAGRHRLRRLLVPDAADRAVSGAARPRLSRNHLGASAMRLCPPTISDAPTPPCSAS